MTPEPGLPTESRTGCALRRRNDAREGLSCAFSAVTRPPARNGRRKEGYRRDSVREGPSGEKWVPEGGLPTGFRTRGPSGEEMTPEPGLQTGFRTRRALRRRNDAGGRSLEQSLSKMGLSASAGGHPCRQRSPYFPSGRGPAARTSGVIDCRRFSAFSTNICASFSAVAS